MGNFYQKVFENNSFELALEICLSYAKTKVYEFINEREQHLEIIDTFEQLGILLYNPDNNPTIPWNLEGKCFSTGYDIIIPKSVDEQSYDGSNFYHNYLNEKITLDSKSYNAMKKHSQEFDEKMLGIK